MTWTKLVTTKCQHNGFNGGVDDQTPAIDTTGADLLVVVGGQSAGGILDSYVNAWTPAAHRVRAGVGVDLNIWYVPHPKVGTGHTFTTFSNGSIEVYAFTGSRAVVAQIVRAIGAAGTTLAAGNITPASDGSLILSAWGLDNTAGGTFSVDDGFSIVQAQDVIAGQTFGVVVASLLQAVAATVNPTLTRTVASDNGDCASSIVLPAASGQTPAIISSTKIASAGTPMTTPSIDTTGATALVMARCVYRADVLTSIADFPTDSAGNRWIALGPADSGTHPLVYWYLCPSPTTSATHNFTATQKNGSFIVIALSGVACADVLGAVGSGGDGSGTNVLAGALTTLVDNALVVAGFQVGDPNDTGTPQFTIDQGFTLDETNDVISGSTWGSVAAHNIQAIAGAVASPTLTRSNSQSVGDQGILISFSPLASLGGSVSTPSPLLLSAMRPGAHGLSGRIAMAMRSRIQIQAPGVTSATFTTIASGGLQSGGAGLIDLIKTLAAAGGLQSGGTASKSLSKRIAASGGLQSGGAATTARLTIFVVTPSGGVQVAGSALVDRHLVVAALGGLQSGGHAPFVLSKQLAGAGGLQSGGHAVADIHFVISALGGLHSGGAAAVTRAGAFIVVGSGGLQSGGAAAIDRLLRIAGAGGLQSGGIGLKSLLKVVAAAGGLQSAGHAPMDIHFAVRGAGGLQSGGAAIVQRAGTVIVVASGGLHTGGGALIDTLHRSIASGGLHASGAAPSNRLLKHLVSGGLQSGGLGVVHVRLVVVPLGGLVSGGLGATHFTSGALLPMALIATLRIYPQLGALSSLDAALSDGLVTIPELGGSLIIKPDV